MRSIGLDIGDYSVKIVELVQNKKNTFINQYQEKILSQNVSNSDKELEVIEFVRSFLSTGDYTQCKWIVCLRQSKVTTRYKTFPFSDRLKIQKSLAFEMEEDIPFDTDNCVFESKVIQVNGPSADVLATAIPKSQVEELIELTNNFGVEISAVTVEGLAFANLIENWQEAPPKSDEILSLEEQKKPRKFVQIVLNIGHKNTLLTAYENKRLIHARSLYWGSSLLIEDIIKKYSVSYVEAVKILQSQAGILLNSENAGFEQTQMSQTITKNLKDLGKDIQMTLLELQSEFNAEVTGLHFTGGASLLPNLGAFLTQQLEVACNPIQLISSYTGALNQTDASLKLIESRFATAVGIAIEGLKKPKNPPTNVLKGEFGKQNDGLVNFWEDWKDVVYLAGAITFVFFVWSSLRTDFSNRLVTKSEDAVKEQAKEVAGLTGRQASESGIKKFIKENKKKITELKLVQQVSQLNSALDVLKKVSDAAPPRSQLKVEIVNFSVRDNNVTVVGYANNSFEVNALASSLKKISSDGTIINQKPALSLRANKTAFLLSFKTNRGVAK